MLSSHIQQIESSQHYTQSHESGGGRFSIVPGTTQTYLSISRMEDHITSTLPGQWNGSTEISEKSASSQGVEILQQGGLLSPYDESFEETSLSSDDKPLQRRGSNNHHEVIRFASSSSDSINNRAAKRRYKVQDHLDKVVELQADLSAEAKALGRAIEGTIAEGEQVQVIDRHERASVAIQGAELEMQMDESKDGHEDEEEHEEYSQGDDENQDAFDLDDLEDESPFSTEYQESLQLDLLTLDLNGDSGLNSLLTDDDLSEFGQFELTENSRNQEESVTRHSPPLVNQDENTFKTPEKEELYSRRAKDVPVDVTGDVAREVKKKCTGYNTSNSLKILESPEELKRRHPGLFDGKGIFFSGPIRNVEPVKVVKKPTKLQVDFALPGPPSSSAAIEIYEDQWNDEHTSHSPKQGLQHEKPLPFLQLELNDEEFTCEMPSFKSISPQELVEAKVETPKPMPSPPMRMQSSNITSPKGFLAEKPQVQPDFSVTIIKPATIPQLIASKVDKEVPQPSIPLPVMSQFPPTLPTLVKPQINQPVIAVTQESKPVVLPIIKTTLNSTSIPLLRKEEAEKPIRLPHPLSQSYSAAVEEEERSLDHPRSSYIAHQLDRFKSSPLPAHSKNSLSQPHRSAGANSPKFETHKVATMVQPSSSDRYSPETFSSISSAPNKDGSLMYLKDQDIDFIEEASVLVQQSALFGVRRRLVGEYADLGYKYNKVSKRKEEKQPAAMRVQSEANSASYTLKRMTLGPEKELREREELLEAREQDLTIEALSKAEMAYVKFEIWTEGRHGRWMIKGPASERGIVADELPQIADVWALPIDSKGVVRRNKCKSNVELSSTKTIVRCPDCLQDTSSILYRRCASCNNTKLVEMVYNVQCTIRLANFTPLTLPARLLLGEKQPHINYIDASDPQQIKEILHNRAVDALQSAASRVYAKHHVQHGSRLLMGRATVTRRGLLTVKVTSFKTKIQRAFDVQDGPDGLITEVTEFICPKVVKRGASPAPSNVFKEYGASFLNGNGSNTSLNSFDKGEDGIGSDRSRSVKSPFKALAKEDRVSSPLSFATPQAQVVAPIAKRGWKNIFAR